MMWKSSIAHSIWGTRLGYRVGVRPTGLIQPPIRFYPVVSCLVFERGLWCVREGKALMWWGDSDVEEGPLMVWKASCLIGGFSYDLGLLMWLGASHVMGGFSCDWGLLVWNGDSDAEERTLMWREDFKVKGQLLCERIRAFFLKQ